MSDNIDFDAIVADTKLSKKEGKELKKKYKAELKSLENDMMLGLASYDKTSIRRQSYYTVLLCSLFLTFMVIMFWTATVKDPMIVNIVFFGVLPIILGTGLVVSKKMEMEEDRAKILTAPSSRFPASQQRYIPLEPLDLMRDETNESIESQVEFERKLEAIRKDSRLKRLEEIIQSLVAIQDIQHVLNMAEQEIVDFEPENKEEEKVFSTLSKLYERMKERYKNESV